MAFKHVSYIKISFLFIAFFLTVLLFMWPSEDIVRLDVGLPDTSMMEDRLKETSVTDVGGTSMLAPRFSGQDNKNRRWELSADQAVQVGEGPSGTVSLQKVEASAVGNKGGSVSFTAGQGVYEQKGGEVSLSDGVVVEGMGFTLKTDELKGNLQTNVLSGDSGVSISNDKGELNAQTFEVVGDGKTMKLSGGVSGRFFLGSSNASSSEDVSSAAEGGVE